jgi:hypothetical protein
VSSAIAGARPVSARTAAAIATAGIAVLFAVTLAPPARVLSRPDRGDLAEYFHYAQSTFHGEVPYRDFILEYPPGFLPVMLAPGTSSRAYFDRFRIVALALASVSIVLLAVALFRVGAAPAELAAGTLVLATLPRMLSPGLVVERFDVWPAMLVLVAVVALLYGRRNFAAAALGLAAAAKVYPLALLPLAILSRRGSAHIRRELAVFASSALALVLPFMLLAPRGLGHVGWLLVRRPLHVESLGGSVLLAAHRLDMYKPTITLSFAQSWDLAGPAAKIVAVASSLVEAAALVAVWSFFARGPRGEREFLLAVAATVVGFVAFGKVLSPQYLVWVAAAVPLALGRARAFVLLGTIVAALLTRHVYVWAYDDLLEAGRTSWVMLARNILLVAIYCSLLLELAARGSRRRNRAAAFVRRRAAGPPHHVSTEGERS